MDPHICVVSLVSDQRASLHLRQKLIGTDQVMRLSAGQEEADRVAEGIDRGVDLGVSTPGGRPMTWFAPSFSDAGNVLVGAHDCVVDHRLFIIGIRGGTLQDPLPHTGFGPVAEPGMYTLPITEAFRKIPPWYPGAIAIQHGLDEKPVVHRRHAHPSLAARQEVSDTIPLIVTQGIAAHPGRHGAPGQPSIHPECHTVL
jgi:hypothetical protein